MCTMSKPSVYQPKLSEHFSKFPLEKQVEGWDELWKNETTPWDRGEHNPALEDTLVQRGGFLGTALQDDNDTTNRTGNKRKKALVPGCGRGFDVFLLAEFGYDAYGLEYSDTAVEICCQNAARVADNIPVRDDRIGKGKVTFVQGDFFKNDWLKTIGVGEGGFDLIYDYTFFCALNPLLRPQWAARMTQLLAPSPRGNLICLEFPTAKDPTTGGPPFASPPTAYMEHLSHPGEEIPYENGHIIVDPLKEVSPNGLERVAHWQPERTHEVGKDDNGNVQDWVAIWRHRS
ncbi:thiol methyltransferase [Histoplasma ohiense]|nr:thiol methyltransferase [Histoplasma ohiense (nom. inval.)]